MAKTDYDRAVELLRQVADAITVQKTTGGGDLHGLQVRVEEFLARVAPPDAKMRGLRVEDDVRLQVMDTRRKQAARDAAESEVIGAEIADAVQTLASFDRHDPPTATLVARRRLDPITFQRALFLLAEVVPRTGDE